MAAARLRVERVPIASKKQAQRITGVSRRHILEVSMARKFFYVCAGLLCLAIAYQMGVRNASAQGVVGRIVGFTDFRTVWPSAPVVMLENGDVWSREWSGNDFTSPPHFLGNFWGEATPTRQRTFGQVKEQYR